MISIRIVAVGLLTIAATVLSVWASDLPPKGSAAGGDATADDAALVKRVLAARKDYQQSLIALYDQYSKSGDRERAKWVEDELKAHHLAWKPSYRLDIQDVPPATLEPRTNSREANELYKMAITYKTRSATGTDYILNQRRAELVFQEILTKYSESDKIADVAYELGDLYEGRAYKQYDRAAAYYERAFQWRRGGVTDARLRAARLYDKMLNERSKAADLYRGVIASDTDPARTQEAERRLAELMGGSRRGP